MKLVVKGELDRARAEQVLRRVRLEPETCGSADFRLIVADSGEVSAVKITHDTLGGGLEERLGELTFPAHASCGVLLLEGRFTATTSE